VFVDLVNLFKEPIFYLLGSLSSSCGLDLMDLSPDLPYFSLSAGYEFDLFLFF
jgi:hypothetical protein